MGKPLNVRGSYISYSSALGYIGPPVYGFPLSFDSYNRLLLNKEILIIKHTIRERPAMIRDLV